MLSHLFGHTPPADGDAPDIPPGQAAPGPAPAGYLFELLTSSGPRKSAVAYNSAVQRELGEDATGLVNLPGCSVFWLADGTSDELILQGFSARILAQDAGTCLTEMAAQSFLAGEMPDLQRLLNLSLEKLTASWQERFYERWDILRSKGEAEAYQKNFARCGDGSLQANWSTTFTAGLIQHESGRLELANLGDAGCLVQCLAGATQSSAMGGERLFIKAQIDPGQDAAPLISITPYPLAADQIQVFEEVQSLLCLTDGNSVVPIKKLLEEHGPRGVAGLAALLKQTRGFSYDDRTLLLARRINPPVVQDDPVVAQPADPQ